MCCFRLNEVNLTEIVSRQNIRIKTDNTMHNHHGCVFTGEMLTRSVKLEKSGN